MARDPKTSPPQAGDAASAPTLEVVERSGPQEGVLRSGDLAMSRELAPALAFHVLSHLDLRQLPSSDLPGDSEAAKVRHNLFDPFSRPRPWTGEVMEAFAAFAGHRLVQSVPMLIRELAGWWRLAEDDSTLQVVGLQSEAGRAALVAVARAMRAEHSAFAEAWVAEEEEARRNRIVVRTGLSTLLRSARRQIWQDESPTAMRILDCPALASAGRARSAAVRGERVVAVSLNQPMAELFRAICIEESAACCHSALAATQPTEPKDPDTLLAQRPRGEALQETAEKMAEAVIADLAPQWSHSA